MRIILYILQKEFIQVFRDKTMLPIIFVIPIIQLLVLSYTATFEIKNVNLAVVDHDKSVMSSKIISKFAGSAFFNFKGNATTYDEAVMSLKRSEIDQILVIEQNFEKNLSLRQSPHIQIVTNAINGSAASLMSAYASSIIADFNREIIIDENPAANVGLPINAQPTFWYNPELNYITYMVPGILVLLVTVIGMFLSGMNLVKEKEIGTIEQINVTPIKKYQFITGKLVPFWIIANIDLAIGLIIAYFVFNIPVIGSLPLFVRCFFSLFSGGFIIGIIGINHDKHYATIDVYFVVFPCYFHYDEWLIYSGGKHATMGTKYQLYKSCCIFYKNKPYDNVERIGLCRFSSRILSATNLCSFSIKFCYYALS